MINLMQETSRKKKMMRTSDGEDKIVEVAQKQISKSEGKGQRMVKSPTRFFIEEMKIDKKENGERAVNVKSTIRETEKDCEETSRRGNFKQSLRHRSL